MVALRLFMGREGGGALFINQRWTLSDISNDWHMQVHSFSLSQLLYICITFVPHLCNFVLHFVTFVPQSPPRSCAASCSCTALPGVWSGSSTTGACAAAGAASGASGASGGSGCAAGARGVAITGAARDGGRSPAPAAAGWKMKESDDANCKWKKK